MTSADVNSRVGRAWVRTYTAPLPAHVRERRRAEIESDLWEQTTTGAHRVDINRRLLRGALDDVAWSLSACAASAHPIRHPRCLFAVAVPLMTGLWLFASFGHRRGGPLERVATSAYWMFFVVGLATLGALVWWVAGKVMTIQRKEPQWTKD